MNGSVKLFTLTPLKTGIIAATIWPSSFEAGGQLEDVVEHAHRGDHDRSAEDRPGRGVHGRNRSPATSTPTRIARPPSFGVGRRGGCARPRMSIASMRRASVSVAGTSSQARAAATANANSA